MKFNTQLVHGGESVMKSTLPPIVQSSAFTFESAEDQEKVFAHKKMGYAYTRIGNPTITAFESRINAIEGGRGALACSSGMAALSLAFLNICQPGDEIIAGWNLYGGTIELFKDLAHYGITTHFISLNDAAVLESTINAHTKVIFGEMLSNPSLEILDVEKVSSIAHDHGLPLFVDNTAATPYLIQPLKHGADVVIHSSSKYINGTSNAISGVIIDGGRFPWDIAQYPSLQAYGKYKKMAYYMRLRDDLSQNIGACLSPQNAYLNVLGLETLGLRMQRICENALALAKHLESLGVKVNYPALHDPLTALLNGHGGGLLTCDVGDKEKAFQVINRLKLAHIVSNIGDVKTLVVHPASTIAVHNTIKEQERAGVYPGTIRVSVGIEDIEDLKADFDQAIKGE